MQDIQIAEGTILIRREIAKNRQQREPRLMALAEWGLKELLYRARSLGATEPHHYLLPLNLRKSRYWSKKTSQKWDVSQPMTTWIKSWRKLMIACKMPGFRFHDLRHTFRTQEDAASRLCPRGYDGTIGTYGSPDVIQDPLHIRSVLFSVHRN